MTRKFKKGDKENHRLLAAVIRKVSFRKFFKENKHKRTEIEGGNKIADVQLS